MTSIDFIILAIVLIFLLFVIRKLQNLSGFTGGKLDEYLKRWEVYAPQSYQKIRETDDISIIAKNAGFSQITISLNLSGGRFYGFLCNVN